MHDVEHEIARTVRPCATYSANTDEQYEHVRTAVRACTYSRSSTCGVTCTNVQFEHTVDVQFEHTVDVQYEHTVDVQYEHTVDE